MMAKRSFIVDISISSDEFMRLYQGQVKDAVAQARKGQVLRFSAQNLRLFLLHDGIHGSFEITISAENKILDLKKLNN